MRNESHKDPSIETVLKKVQSIVYSVHIFVSVSFCLIKVSKYSNFSGKTTDMGKFYYLKEF